MVDQWSLLRHNDGYRLIANRRASLTPPRLATKLYGRMRTLRPKLTYSNVMVTVLAFIVLGGGAYAATRLARNSVGTKQLKPNAVTGAKVKNGSLTGADLSGPVVGNVNKLEFDKRNCTDECDSELLGVGNGDLTITARCIPQTGDKQILQLDFARARADATLDWSYLSDANGSQDQTVGGTGASATTVSRQFTAPLTGNEHAGGQFVYRDSSRIVSVQFALYVSTPSNSCWFAGTSTEATASRP
jgi:hypothetical protein